MQQMTFAEFEYAHKKRKTRREIFLEKLAAVIPWKQLDEVIAKHYTKTSKTGGRPQYPLQTMLRVHVMQVVYNFSHRCRCSDGGYILNEVHSMRLFARLILNKIPGETTILNFSRLLEQYNLCEKIFLKISKQLTNHGLLLRAGNR